MAVSKEDEYTKAWVGAGFTGDDIDRTRAAAQQTPQVSIQNFSGHAFFLGRVAAGDLPDLIARLKKGG
jgi:hypothetical protein